MTDWCFVDANIFLRFILNDIPDQSSRCRDLLKRIEGGSEHVVTSDSAVSEAVFTLDGRRIAMPRPEITRAVLDILKLDGVRLDSNALYPAAFGRFVTGNRLSFADCLHATQADALTKGRIYSFDRGFDRLPGIARNEPA